MKEREPGVVGRGLWLAGCIALPLVVGGVSALLTGDMGDDHCAGATNAGV